jgi:hypothetical protein
MSKTKTTKFEGPAENIAIYPSHMQSVETKYYGPTNTRGSRLRARAGAGSVSVPYDYALNLDGNHAAACEAFLRAKGWVPSQGEGFRGKWVGGTLPNGTMCWSFLPEG